MDTRDTKLTPEQVSAKIMNTIYPKHDRQQLCDDTSIIAIGDELVDHYFGYKLDGHIRRYPMLDELEGWQR